MNNPLSISIMSSHLIDANRTDEAYLDERYRFLKECGIESLQYDDNFEDPIDLSKGVTSHFWDKTLEELYEFFTPTKNAARRHGITFAQLHALFPLYFKNNGETTEYAQMATEKMLAVAAFLDCPIVVVHPYNGRDKEAGVEINLALYRRLMPAAKKYGVKICLENLFMNANGRGLEGACSTPEEACRYIDKLNGEAGEEVFGFCLDTGHANLLGKDLKSFIIKLGHRLACLHIHDNDGVHDSHALPFTHTVCWSARPSTDWSGMLDALRKIGYRGSLSFEDYKPFLVFPQELHEDLLKMHSAIGRYFRDKIING